MNEWWQLLSGLEKFYWVSALSGSALFVIQMTLTIFGINHHTDMISDDLGNAGMTGADVKDKFQVFTIRNIILFFAFFGWTGILTLGNGFGWIESMIAGTLAGGSMMYGMAALMKGLLGFAIDKTLHLKDAINEVGEVYLTIPAKESGIGKIHVNIKGTLREVDAKSIDKVLKVGTKIRVIDVLKDDTLLVDEVGDDDLD